MTEHTTTTGGREDATRRILVGVDGSQPSIGALRTAARAAELIGGTVVAVTAWQFPMFADGYAFAAGFSPDEDAKQILADAEREAFGDELPPRYTRIVVGNAAAAALIEESRNAALLVVGTRGRGGVAGMLLGSVSSAVAQHAFCPVLIDR